MTEEDELIGLLESLDVRDRKDALQRICRALEGGARLSLANNLTLANLIARQRHSTDLTVRRWFYKYVGLMQADSYLPWLLGKLRTETDLQTLAWLVGAIVAILGPSEAARELLRYDLPEEVVNNAEIYGAYFRPELVQEPLVELVTTRETPLSLRWATFLNARWRKQQLGLFVRELGEHEDPEVAEFSIWSAIRSGAALRDTLIDPDKI